MQVTDLKVQITVPKYRYVPGRGFTGEKQLGIESELTFDWHPGQQGGQIGLRPNLTFDVIIQFDHNTVLDLPNLFCLLNGLPTNQEVEIPDVGYESRGFYVLGRKFIVRSLIAGDPRYMERQLEYMLQVFSDKRFIIAMSKSTRTEFTEDDIQLISDVINGNSARKRADELRQLQARIAMILKGSN